MTEQELKIALEQNGSASAVLLREVYDKLSGGAKGGGVVKTTYTELKTLRDNGELSPGTWYRITDYQCTTTQEDTQSAGHQFDVLVLALDDHTLSEEARAIQHEGDTYFSGCKLEAWKIWYSLDNDAKRFLWADEENGKGVIYRMIDEWNNDVPYDFKNIQFIRTLADGMFDPDGDEVFVYTFNWYDENEECKDSSIVGNDGSILNDEGLDAGTHANIIKPYHYIYGQAEQKAKSCRLKLNDIAFLSSYNHEGGVFYGCNSNAFGDDCRYNTFGNDCNYNAFGDNCYSNTFGNSDGYNTLCTNCCYNTFGVNCWYVILGNGVRDKSISDDASHLQIWS